ncbi:hypothetical protein BC941DRAFT_468657 [Chlamydoabsidia padenii]|nr:hypothetical protein BC941DRAFT_468657 [Chlamydoabsidia padenii]
MTRRIRITQCTFDFNISVASSSLKAKHSCLDLHQQTIAEDIGSSADEQKVGVALYSLFLLVDQHPHQDFDTKAPGYKSSIKQQTSPRKLSLYMNNLTKLEGFGNMGN